MHFQRMFGRPKTRRLLSLYIHTIPLFGPAVVLSYFTSKANHQPLKSSILRSTNWRSPINTIHNLIMKAWFRKTYEAIHLTCVDDDQLRAHAMQNLRRFQIIKLWMIMQKIIGSQLVSWRAILTNRLKNNLTSALWKTFSPVVLTALFSTNTKYLGVLQANWNVLAWYSITC